MPMIGFARRAARLGRNLMMLAGVFALLLLAAAAGVTIEEETEGV